MKVSYKKNITYFLLVLFISIKMTGLHALFHTDDDHAVHCVICDNVITHNLTPALTPDIEDFIVESTEFFIHKEIINHYSFSSSSAIESSQLFSRPPPSLI